ncbi:AAA family ATPase [Helicobacter cinaedi]|uniref:AAA domain-containing protein n=2 Tax=Helicobacter cinaedi TaxID=213 RepID=A0AAI8MNX9_9HELI|nr:AAA family ATPase [Helicobacter cinaedi]EFR45617.1 hypothetical protein HCCG_00163 [Helicobacter cinaedi CCUG 18818 = ATCC BAA-847]QOQ91080.1 AAA family ATPase [Helicobacter cinaedi]BAM32991.1 hypothetical protein HCBAA847_1771 [Helicobacter cinaedi CCUG 18818 = ATCC BAA-847]
MIQQNINQINESNKNKRYAVDIIKDFFNANKEKNGKIVVLYGLRRIGKTTIMNQIIDEYKNSLKCAFYEIETNDKMDNIYDMLICERDKGIKLICLDKITNAKDFIEDSAILADIFAKEGMKIRITGTESLGFYFAENKGFTPAL